MIDAPDLKFEPFQFSSRLLFSYVLAVLSFMAAGDSLWIGVVSTIGWTVVVVRLFVRFRVRAGWALIGAPLALFWLYQILHRPAANAGAVFI
jgi:hypothetical protein